MGWKILCGFLVSAVIAFGAFCRLHNSNKVDPALVLYSEFDRTEMIALSDKILGQFKGAQELVEKIVAAKSRVLFFSQEPLGSDKLTWMRRVSLPDHLVDKIDIVPVVHDSYWLRDFSPLPTQFEPKIFDRYFLSSFRFRAQDKIEDAVGYQLAMFLNLNLIYAPVFIDGGNFITNGKDCVMSDSMEFVEKKTSAADFFRRYFGCKTTLVITDSPHEHIDMVVHFASADTVLVNQISLLNIEKFNLTEEELALTRKTEQQLDAVAAQLAPHFKIQRVPMPVMLKGLFRTYANMIIVGRSALMPSYKYNELMEIPYPDAAELLMMESEMKRIFTNLGYETSFIPADDLIMRGGAIHCLSANLPAIDVAN